MQIQLDRDTFLRGLQMVQNIVEPRQTLPILANVLLEATEDSVRLTTTDLELGARVSVPAEVRSQGVITLSARKLMEIVKELPPAHLSIESEEQSRLSLRCEGVAYRLATLAADEFPAVISGEPLAEISLDTKLLREMLAQTSFAISHDESRYALNGLLFSLQPGELRLIATDGHRLAMASRRVPGGAETSSGIVPRKAVHEVARVLGAGDQVQIGLAENQFLLRMPNFLLTARLIEGQFPNYTQVIPREQPRRLVLSRTALVAALRRVSLLSEERTRPIKLSLVSGSLKVSASSSELGEAEETLRVEDSGEELTIGFNSRYLLDALNPLETDQVVFELKDGLSPGVLKSFGEEAYLCVIMPMRI
ncbi:MAG: DNA polymerase III subunit beta [Candidatus Methylomirabilia bacterium]